MALFINTNVLALTAQNKLGQTQDAVGRAVTRLSTGLRINNAADDAAGLAISERLTAQIRGLGVAVRNANDGISVLQTADGSLQEVTNLLQRARELAVQSASDSNNVDDRQSLNSEVKTILAELDRLANAVSFNGNKLLDGTFSNRQFQVGPDPGQTVAFSIDSAKTNDLGATVREGYGVSNTAISAFTVLNVNGTAIDVSGKSTIESVIDTVNNKAGDTGVTAKKNLSTVVVDTGFTAVLNSSVSTLKINDVAISLTTTTAGTVSDFVATVNSYTNQTGVVVSTSATGVVFTHKGGGDIKFDETTSTNGVSDTVASTAVRTFNAGVTLTVKLGGTLSVSTGSTATATNLGLSTAVTQVTIANGDKRVNSLNITTVSGSNDAIRTADLALDLVNRLRSDMGAAQNRFSSAVNSLQIASENLSAARSRIRDADVARETAELTQKQILLQAGVAVLAQANQLPSVALSLLGG